MAGLELKFLGGLEVLRDGRSEPLPPSRKTRALLAYLALNERSFRREHLCELLWEVPDDPRGSLRWSLSKLRRLVDDSGQTRIEADRSRVRFCPETVEIDVLALRQLVERLQDAPTEALEQAAQRFSGYFLEGLELSNFHEFHAWCVAERELTTRAQVDLLRELVSRKQADPDAALPFARSLVSIAPYSESARESLIRLLVATDRSEEARQQYALGARMLREAGAQPTGALSRALEGERSADRGNEEQLTSAVPSRGSPVDLRAVENAGQIVGREDELAALVDAIESAAAKREARVLLLRGEPGIGKSRLLDVAAELAARAGAWVARASAFESESIRPYAVWIDALRQADSAAADEIFGSREHENNRERLLEGLSDLVCRRARVGLVVLIFDDLQWCDDSSATALHYVARTNRQLPIVAVLAAREGEIQDNAPLQQALNGLRHAGLLAEVALAPLAPAVIRELIAGCAPGIDSERLAEQCGGNPLIAIELARAELSGDSGGSLGELIRERVSRLGVDAGEVLRWAAVLAPGIDVGMLEQLAEMGPGDTGIALELGERQGIVRMTDAGYRFSHDLVARSIYTDISPARRRMMHRRIAELLERQTAVDLEYASDLAHHAAQSGDVGLAARAMVSAGRLCLRFYANEEALALAQRGLGLVGTLADGERIRLSIDFEDIAMTAAPLEDWEAAVEKYIALAEQALDHGALSHARRAYFMASDVRWMHGHWSGAREEVLQSERVARGASDEDHVLGMAEAARCLALLERDLAHADAMLMEAQALATRRGIAHHSIPSALGMLRFHEDSLDSAQELFNEARTLAKSAGDRMSEYQANEYLVMIAIERGDYASAQSRCKALLEIGSKLRAGSEAPFACVLDAVCAYALGDEPDSMPAALDALREADAKHRLAYALTRAAEIDFERGRFESAIERAGEALENARALDRATDILLAHVVLARAHRALGDDAGFERHSKSTVDFEPGRVAAWARLRAEEHLAS